MKPQHPTLPLPFRNEHPTEQGLKAAAAYFAIVFALGFALGTVRVLIIVPQLGEAAAVLLEAPVMVAASWFAARSCVAKFAVPPGAAERLTMGFVAFGLLMVAELGLSVTLFGRNISEHLATYSQFAGFTGLMAQLVFALFPFLQRPRK